MRLIFIRHAEPDYPNNTLTPRGFEEARLLSARVSRWKVDRFYASPLARALLTAEPSLQRLQALDMHTGDITEVDWLKEFSYFIIDPTTGRKHVPWDFMPQYWTVQPQLRDAARWYEHPLMQSAEGYEEAVHALREGLDHILLEYGYTRNGDYYLTDDEKTAGDDNTTVVFFGHLGANLEAIGYLLSISPLVLQQTIFLAPTSVSILNFEKRTPGIAMARAQVLGSTSHLYAADEPLSRAGAFSDVSDL